MPTEEPLVVTAEMLNTSKKKINWSSPGNDKITNFWIEKLTPLHEGLSAALTEIINNEILLPVWLKEGRCVVIQKVDNPTAKVHRPIT